MKYDVITYHFYVVNQTIISLANFYGKIVYFKCNFHIICFSLLTVLFPALSVITFIVVIALAVDKS